MKVRCLYDSAKDLPEDYLDPRAGYRRETEFRLTIGKDYVVYALALRGSQVWYYVCDDAELWFPVHHPAPLFATSDPQTSRYWRYHFTPEHRDHIALFAFKEWCDDDFFYERLSDKAAEETKIFATRRRLMDSEAAVSE